MKQALVKISWMILAVIFVPLSGCKGNVTSSSSSKLQLSVTTDTAILNKDIKVEWISPELDNIVVFENGNTVDVEIPDAEKDVFEVYLGSRVIGGGGIRRSSPGSQNEFFFHIAEKGGKPVLEFTVVGPDSTNEFFLKRYVRDLVGNISRIEYFDEQGLKIYETYEKLNINGELEAENRIDYDYNDEGQKIRQVHTSSSPEGHLLSRVENTYMYDEAGRVKEQAFASYGKDNEVKNRNINRFKYNEAAKLIEKEFIGINKDGEKVSHFITEYKYNEKGINVSDLQYNGERVLMNRIDREYSEQGSLIKEIYIEYNPDGSVKSRHGREYDAKGKILKEF